MEARRLSALLAPLAGINQLLINALIVHLPAPHARAQQVSVSPVYQDIIYPMANVYPAILPAINAQALKLGPAYNV